MRRQEADSVMYAIFFLYNQPTSLTLLLSLSSSSVFPQSVSIGLPCSPSQGQLLGLSLNSPSAISLTLSSSAPVHTAVRPFRLKWEQNEYPYKKQCSRHKSIPLSLLERSMGHTCSSFRPSCINFLTFPCWQLEASSVRCDSSITFVQHARETWTLNNF